MWTFQMIHIDSSFIKSRFSRRIFLLFVSSTVLPILVIALLSFNHVSSHLRQQSHLQSHRVSKAIGMELIRDLTLASDELGIISRELRTTAYRNSSEILRSTIAGLKRNAAIALITGNGEATPLSGNAGIAPELTDRQQQHLGLGKTVVDLRKNSNGTIDILMLRLVDPKHPSLGTLFSRVAPKPLQEAENLLPYEARLVVLTPSNEVLFSEQQPPPDFFTAIEPLLETAISGEFRWGNENHEQLASYWVSLHTLLYFKL